MILKLEGEINEELFNLLVDAHNNCPYEDVLTVYFSSDGGDLGVTEAIIDLINESEKIDIIKAYGGLFSGGFFIPMLVKKPVEFLNYSVGMIHTAWFPSAPIYGNKEIHKHSKELYEEMFKSCNTLIDTIENLKILNKTELKRFKNNEDVYLSVDRLREMREIVWKTIVKENESLMEEYIKQLSNQETVEDLLQKQEDINSRLKEKWKN